MCEEWWWWWWWFNTRKRIRGEESKSARIARLSLSEKKRGGKSLEKQASKKVCLKSLSPLSVHQLDNQFPSSPPPSSKKKQSSVLPLKSVSDIKTRAKGIQTRRHSLIWLNLPFLQSDLILPFLLHSMMMMMMMMGRQCKPRGRRMQTLLEHCNLKCLQSAAAPKIAAAAQLAPGQRTLPKYWPWCAIYVAN